MRIEAGPFDVAQIHTTTELVSLAKSRTSDALWDFILGGGETETTMLRNRHALDTIAFRPRILRRVHSTDTTVEFLGQRQRLPVFLAPLGALTAIEADAALHVARAAARFGCFTLLSSVAGTELERVAPVAEGRLIYQLYIHGDERWVDTQLRRATDAGCAALCLTVDCPHYGRRERSIIRRHSIPGRPFTKVPEQERHAMQVDWSLVDHLKQQLKMPLIVKGIATAEDALLAVQHGVDVVYVSNHGGRQLDHSRGTIDVLPEVVSAVGDRADVIVDGGFVRGTDVIKAAALGARVVGIGRLQALALAAAGELGVERMLELLEIEIAVTMKLLGVNHGADLDATYLHAAAPCSTSGPLSAFPLLDSVQRRSEHAAEDISCRAQPPKPYRE